MFMQFKTLLVSLAAGALLAAALPATAEDPDPHRGLTEQQREQMRERWEQMSPEERAELRRRSDAYWAGLSEAEREAKREELRKYHAEGERNPKAADPHAGIHGYDKDKADQAQGEDPAKDGMGRPGYEPDKDDKGKRGAKKGAGKD
jgi:hypothetical protein